MADPLSDVVDRFAPARTNFLDPGFGQSVIARYGNAGVGLSASNGLAESAVRLRRSREDRLGRTPSPFEMERQDRMRKSWDREDAEFEAKKETQAQRGDFLKAVSLLDPEADDYEDRRNELLTSLPQGALDDDGFKAIMTTNDRVAGERRASSERDRVRDEILKDRNDIALQKALARAAEAGLPPDKFPRDTAGNVDADELAFLAGTYKREHAAAAKEETADARNKEWDRRHEIMDASKMATEMRKNPVGKEIETIIGNAMVFPSQMSALKENNPKLDDAALKKKFPAEYDAARSYDSNQLERELGSAINAADEDAYVNLVNGRETTKGKITLNDEQKELRRKVYRAAKAAMGPPAPAAAKPLDRAGAAALLKEAAGDRAKARELARERGFTF